MMRNRLSIHVNKIEHDWKSKNQTYFRFDKGKQFELMIRLHFSLPLIFSILSLEWLKCGEFVASICGRWMFNRNEIPIHFAIWHSTSLPTHSNTFEIYTSINFLNRQPMNTSIKDEAQPLTLSHDFQLLLRLFFIHQIWAIFFLSFHDFCLQPFIHKRLFTSNTVQKSNVTKLNSTRSRRRFVGKISIKIEQQKRSTTQ